MRQSVFNLRLHPGEPRVALRAMGRLRWFWNVLKVPTALAGVLGLIVVLLITRPWSGGGATSSPPLQTNPVTTVVGGRTVFVIHPAPPCPSNASCAPEVVINKHLWNFSDYPSSPKPIYRTGPLYAVGPDKEAHLIAAVSTDRYQVVALRVGSNWYFAYSPGVPQDDAMQRSLCSLAESIPAGSYCVTHLGFSPTTSPGASSPHAAGPVSGYYADGPADAPRYVLSVSISTAVTPGEHLTGWLFFVYQDGHVSPIFHYSTSVNETGSTYQFALVTDTTTQSFPYGSPPPFPQAGSQPIPVGREFSATYASGTLTLSDCGAYLYWADAAHSSKAMSCTFSYTGTNAW